MIKGIGVDICSTKRLSKILNNDKTSFINNTFSNNEIEESKNYKNPAQFFASRFAAKEAFLKCLGIGIFNTKLSLNEISIEKEQNGKPYIIINNDVMIKDLEEMKIHLSISHENDICTAFVVIEKN